MTSLKSIVVSKATPINATLGAKDEPVAVKTALKGIDRVNAKRDMVNIHHSFTSVLAEGLYVVDDNKLVPLVHAVDYNYRFDRGHQFIVYGYPKATDFVVVDRTDERMTPLRAMCCLSREGFSDIRDLYLGGAIDRKMVVKLQSEIIAGRPLDLDGMLRAHGYDGTSKFTPEHLAA